MRFIDDQASTGRGIPPVGVIYVVCPIAYLWSGQWYSSGISSFNHSRFLLRTSSISPTAYDTGCNHHINIGCTRIVAFLSRHLSQITNHITVSGHIVGWTLITCRQDANQDRLNTAHFLFWISISYIYLHGQLTTWHLRYYVHLFKLLLQKGLWYYLPRLYNSLCWFVWQGSTN